MTSSLNPRYYLFKCLHTFYWKALKLIKGETNAKQRFVSFPQKILLIKDQKSFNTFIETFVSIFYFIF